MSLILNIIVILLVFEAKVYSYEEIDELDTPLKNPTMPVLDF